MKPTITKNHSPSGGAYRIYLPDFLNMTPLGPLMRAAKNLPPKSPKICLPPTRQPARKKKTIERIFESRDHLPYDSERIFPLSTAFFTKKFKSTFLGRQKELRAQIFTQVRSLRVFWKSDVDFSKSDVDFQKFWYFEKKIGKFQKKNQKSKFLIF